MSWRVRAAIVTAVLLIAFGLGLFVQRQYRWLPMPATSGTIQVDDDVDTPPGWDEWRFPGAVSRGGIQSSGVRLMGEMLRPAGYYAVDVTDADLEEVARFYAERLGFEDPGEVAASKEAFLSSGEPTRGDARFVLDDMTKVDQPAELRNCRTKCLMRRSRSYDVSVVLSTGESSATHILLLYDPHVERTE